ncbi:MAG: HAD family hydrolase [Bacilli bacterium]|jgi:phosphoglycolate phosphatase|nr:HAD family hydrolase [Bacilli bacterium]
MYKAIFFDLDGTLLDTLTDIRIAINEALEKTGFPMRYSKRECHYLIGNGVDYLVHTALGDMDTSANFEKLKPVYMDLYAKYQNDHTKPFNGLPTILRFLKDKDYLLFVCSNKPDALAKIVVPAHYGNGLFKEVAGHVAGEPVKPSPIIVNRLMGKYGLSPDECLFVGDSLPDLLTANNAHMKLCLCTWGYGFYKPELLDECAYVIAKPRELARKVLSSR